MAPNLSFYAPPAAGGIPVRKSPMQLPGGLELRLGAWLRLPGVKRPVHVLRRLGAGSDGVVYEVALEKRTLALKLMPFSERLMRAQQLQRAAASPFVLPMLHATKHRQQLVLLQAFAQGGALDTLVHQARRTHVAVPWHWLVTWFAQIVDAVADCHRRGITHYDVALKNILLVGASRTRLFALAATQSPPRLPPATAKLGDFTLASRARVPDGRGTVSSLGPEALWGIASGTAQDVFALGCCLFALVLGVEPYDADTEEEVIIRLLENRPTANCADLQAALILSGAPRGVAAHLASLAQHMLLRDPAQRPRASAVRIVLQALLG